MIEGCIYWSIFQTSSIDIEKLYIKSKVYAHRT